MLMREDDDLIGNAGIRHWKSSSSLYVNGSF
jgi:hypothetical protein